MEIPKYPPKKHVQASGILISWLNQPQNFLLAADSRLVGPKPTRAQVFKHLKLMYPMLVYCYKTEAELWWSNVLK